jgi:hypothetical protein
MDPLSCLAHESSSLCSFQGTSASTLRPPAIASFRSNRVRPRFVPSKLNSAVPTKDAHAHPSSCERPSM